MAPHRLGLLYAQRRLIEDRTHEHLLALGGVGSGKTTLGYPWHYSRCIINAQSDYSFVIGETGKYTKLLFEGYVKFLESIGMRERTHFRGNRSAPQSIKFYWGHQILFWSAETKIVSVTSSHDWQDEPALFQRETTWEIDQRRRCPKAALLQSLSTTSPEGMNHLYEFFNPEELERDGRYSSSDRKLVLHSSSYDNPFLPAGYLRNLEERFGWDDLYFRNYVLGEWVNLARNAFYFAFSEDNIQPCPIDMDSERLVWTLDNNVGKMQWAAIQPLGKDFRVCHANAGTARNVQEACEEFIKAFPPPVFGNWYIPVLGDFKLRDRSNQSYVTALDIIEELMKPHYPNLSIEVPITGNPLVVERSMTSNKLLKEVRLLIDPSCKRVIHSARATQSDGKGGIVKPSKDVVTHGMECVDHALCVLEPVQVRREIKPIVW